MNQKNFQSHFGYLSHRSITPKINTNSPTSSNNIQTSFEKSDKDQNKNKKPETDQIMNIHKENSILKEQNRVLKRQLNYYRAQNLLQGSAKEGKSEVNDLRQTIKKEAGQIKDLKTRLQMLSKQCKMYEDIIDKMEQKINKLMEQNNSLQEQLKGKGKNEKNEQGQGTGEKGQIEGQRISIECLTEKVNDVVSEFQDLEIRFMQENSQWQRWKQHWNKEKGYYLHRIQDLERMTGISNEYSDFSKSKRF